MVKEHWADSIIPPLFIWLFMMFDSRYTETQKIRLDATLFASHGAGGSAKYFLLFK